MISTLIPGVLSVGSAFPGPPFEFMERGIACGFDIELMQLISSELNLKCRVVPYSGDKLNDIFNGLAAGTWDCVASGATITEERERMASFCAPYFRSGQSLVCNINATPQVRSLDDLHGLTLGVQHGNTSEPVAHRLQDEGRIAAVRTYAYNEIAVMLEDLAAGKIAAVMKLAPVMRWFIKDRPALRLVQEGITDEALAVSVCPKNVGLLQAINHAQARLAAHGALAGLISKWLSPGSVRPPLPGC